MAVLWQHTQLVFQGTHKEDFNYEAQRNNMKEELFRKYKEVVTLQWKNQVNRRTRLRAASVRLELVRERIKGAMTDLPERSQDELSQAYKEQMEQESSLLPFHAESPFLLMEKLKKKLGVENALSSIWYRSLKAQIPLDSGGPRGLD